MSGYDGYGIRARKDLSANPRQPRDLSRALHADELDKAARMLNGMIADANRRQSSHVFVPTHAAERLVNALFLAAQTLTETKGDGA